MATIRNTICTGKHSFNMETDKIPFTVYKIPINKLEVRDVIVMRSITDFNVIELYYVKSINTHSLTLLECDEYGNTNVLTCDSKPIYQRYNSNTTVLLINHNKLAQ